MTDFARRLLAWFDQNGRKDLPWQRDVSPYRVWVSEIMLQQTRVATVIPYYERFMASFPGVVELADAEPDEVLHHWSGLGYYARARNLHEAARRIRDRHAGQVPTDFEALLALPGIGRSTAGAILAIACGRRVPILDGNVKRVLARYHAIAGWPGKAAVGDRLWAAAESHTPASRVAEYTQAIMDLGATLCTRSRPACPSCPFAGDCTAHAQGNETAYPGRKPRRDKPRKSTVMLLAHAEGELYLERRPAAGIWGGLWSLPEIGDPAAVDDWCRSRLQSAPAAVSAWQVLRHGFSHYDLDIRPLEVRLESPSRTVADRDNEIWYSLAAPPGIGLAAPVRALIERLRQAGTEP